MEKTKKLPHRPISLLFLKRCHCQPICGTCTGWQPVDGERFGHNKWAAFKRYLNSYALGEVFSRAELIEAIEYDKGKYQTEFVVEHYRKSLELAGYLKRFARGKYQLINYIPIDLSLPDLIKSVHELRDRTNSKNNLYDRSNIQKKI